MGRGTYPPHTPHPSWPGATHPSWPAATRSATQISPRSHFQKSAPLGINPRRGWYLYENSVSATLPAHSAVMSRPTEFYYSSVSRPGLYWVKGNCCDRVTGHRPNAGPWYGRSLTSTPTGTEPMDAPLFFLPLYDHSTTFVTTVETLRCE